MVQLTPQSRIFVAIQPVDFRKGIDGLAAVCRQVLNEQPLSGAVFVFRNRSATTLKLLFYDGQGYWLCTKRLSQGRFQWWPRSEGDGAPCQPENSSCCSGMGSPIKRRWLTTGEGSTEAASASPGTSTATRPQGRRPPRGGALATPPGNRRH